MHTTIDEIAPDIFRLSTYVAEVALLAGLSFNQFLIRGDDPFLFHTGMRHLFPLVSEAVSRLIPIDPLRWISFAHVEADEFGAMNQFLAAAPQAEVVHGAWPSRSPSTTSPTVRRGRWATTKRSTSADTGCGSCRRLTSRTTGRAACGSTRPPAPCSPATSSPRSVAAPRSRATT